MTRPARLISLALAALLCAAPLTACDEETLAELDSALSTAEAELTLEAGNAPAEPSATTRPRPTRTPAAPAAATASAGAPPAEAGTWTIMLYQDADDEILEEDIYIDLNEAERVGSTDQVTLVSQLDRYRGGFAGDGNWTGARRYVLEQDDDLDGLASPVAEDLGEVNMADGDTLVDFITWAAANYPADHYALILSDHGTGWPGGWTDPTARGDGPDEVPIARAFGDMLYLHELDRALQRALAEAGIERFDVIGLDACLMAQIEVFSALQPYARYAVASEETEPGLGWAYTGFLGALAENPGMDGAALSRAIVETYIVADQRIVDPQAREAYVGRSVSASAAAQSTGEAATLSAVDLSQVPAVLAALDDFAVALGEITPKTVARARTYAQSFESVFGDDVPPSYIDLAHFATLAAQQSGDAAVTDAARALLTVMQSAVIAQTNGPERPGAYGMAVYFPNSQLFKNSMSGYASYTGVAERFAANSLWDDFLVAHYSGAALARTLTLPTPAPEADGVAPGAGTIALAPIRLSAKTATAAQPVILTTQVTGDSVGFIYLFVGYYDEARNALLFADQDFIEGDGTQAVNGVFYPTWDGPEIGIEFEWEPTLFAIDDGTRVVQALLSPEDYGATADQATFATEGRYHFAGGDERYAKVIFNGTGELKTILGFSNADGTGAPSEITPAAGDTFVMLDTWYDLATQDYFTTDGETLTFTDTPWTFTTIPAPAGLYNIGFIAEDLDGNYSEAYVDVQVR